MDFPGKNIGVGGHSFSRGSSLSTDRTHVSCLAGRWILYHCAIWEAQGFNTVSNCWLSGWLNTDRRPGFNLWVGKIPWRREWQPTPAFLSGESHRQRSLTGYSPWGPKELNMTERLSVSTALLRAKFLSLLFDLRPGALKFSILRPLTSKLPISWSFLWIFMGRRSRKKGRLPSPPIPPSLGQPNSFAVVQSLSLVWLFATPWTAAGQASLSFTISWILLKLMSIESVISSNHLILYHPCFLLPIFPSIRVFSDDSALHIRWIKY